jgi:hypothetical protein
LTRAKATAIIICCRDSAGIRDLTGCKQMSDSPHNARSTADNDLQREIRKERKFTLEEAIGRLAGPGAMKGASPVARKQQAEAAIGDWLKLHLTSSQEALQTVLLRQIAQSQFLLNNYDQPLIVLAGYCRLLLHSDNLLQELVRDSDCEWGRVFRERPYFDKPGCTPDPDDPFTIGSVRHTLSALIEQLAKQQTC